MCHLLCRTNLILRLPLYTYVWHLCVCILVCVCDKSVLYLHVVSSSKMTWVRGSHRSFPFLERRAWFLVSFLIALGWSGSPRCVPHTPRSRSWSPCCILISSPPPAPSFPLLTPLRWLPVFPPPSPSSLPLIVPAEVGMAQLSLARTGKWQSHSQCCWPCWCRGAKVFHQWTQLERGKPKKRAFSWVCVRTEHVYAAAHLQRFYRPVFVSSGCIGCMFRQHGHTVFTQCQSYEHCFCFPLFREINRKRKEHRGVILSCIHVFNTEALHALCHIFMHHFTESTHKYSSFMCFVHLRTPVPLLFKPEPPSNISE